MFQYRFFGFKFLCRYTRFILSKSARAHSGQVKTVQTLLLSGLLNWYTLLNDRRVQGQGTRLTAMGRGGGPTEDIYTKAI